MKATIYSVLFVLGCSAAGPRPLEPEAVKPVEVELFVMSLCPFAADVEASLGPVFERLGRDAVLKLGFIGDEIRPFEFDSLHGPDEVFLDKIELCAAEKDRSGMPAMLACIAAKGDWRACLTPSMDADAIERCASSDEGSKLLSVSFQESSKRGIEGSPTIFIAGKPYEGARSSGAFLRAICASYDGRRPFACEGLKEPAPITAIVLDDRRCENCRTSEIVAALKSIVPWVAPRLVDYSTEEGRALYATLSEYGYKHLPLLFIEKSVIEADEEAFGELKPYFDQFKGRFYVLRTGSAFDPTAELCLNGIDDDGNGLTDCEDAACSGNPLCRPEIPLRLDLFVMSKCPFAIRAEASLREVLRVLGDRLDLHVHYLVVLADNKILSLHGEEEVKEDILQACVQKHHRKLYYDFIQCRNSGTADWKSCLPHGAKRVKRCIQTDEGTSLLVEDAKLAKELGIRASPTWLANNRYLFHAISARDILSGFCRYNPGKGCDEVLEGDEGPPTGGCIH